MRAPMVVLAAGAVFSGMLLTPMGTLEWWQGAISISEHHHALHNAHHSPAWVKFTPLLLAITGITLSWYLFGVFRHIPKALAKEWDLPYAISLNKWYIDELYDILWVRPTRAIGRFFQAADKHAIDGLINGTATGIKDLATTLRPLQTGYVYHYAFTMVVALVGILTWLLWKSAH